MPDAQPPLPGPSLSLVTCSRCGGTADGPPLSWMSERDPRRGTVWFCDRCARTHLRSIEAKLEQEYW